MLLFSQRMTLLEKFYEWVDSEPLAERTPAHFLVFMTVNGLLDERKVTAFNEKKTKGVVRHEQPTA
jgi:hypothetical protein